MNTRTILDLLKAPHSLMEEIPTGRKDGKFYFINNEENIKRRGNKEHSEFWDDCGAWESGTSQATLFTEVGGKLISVKLYKSLYVTEKRVNKKKEFIPLDPQPPKSAVLKVHRFYQILQASPKGPWQFRRRITWLEKYPVL